MNEPRPAPDDDEDDLAEPHVEHGGPYFGRLLIVLLAAVAFCGLLTWYLGTTLEH